MKKMFSFLAVVFSFLTLTGETQPTTQISADSPKNTSEVGSESKTAIQLKQILIDANGTIWGIDTQDVTYKWTNSTWEQAPRTSNEKPLVIQNVNLPL